VDHCAKGDRCGAADRCAAVDHCVAVDRCAMVARNAEGDHFALAVRIGPVALALAPVLPFAVEVQPAPGAQVFPLSPVVLRNQVAPVDPSDRCDLLLACRFAQVAPDDHSANPLHLTDLREALPALALAFARFDLIPVWQARLPLDAPAQVAPETHLNPALDLHHDHHRYEDRRPDQYPDPGAQDAPLRQWDAFQLFPARRQ
jgi:hypothetical protein